MGQKAVTIWCKFDKTSLGANFIAQTRTSAALINGTGILLHKGPSRSGKLLNESFLFTE